MRRLQARFVPRRGYASERALPRRQLENGTVNPAEMGGGEGARGNVESRARSGSPRSSSQLPSIRCENARRDPSFQFLRRVRLRTWIRRNAPSSTRSVRVNIKGGGGRGEGYPGGQSVIAHEAVRVTRAGYDAHLPAADPYSPLFLSGYISG